MDKTASRLYTIFFGLVVLTVSSIYKLPGGIRLNLLLYPQVAVYAVLGFFHAFNMMRFKSCARQEPVSGAYEILDLISDWLLYTAWYNVILFPLSGFGVIEWAGVFFILISGFVSDLSGTAFSAARFLGHSPMMLLVTGTALFLFKTIVFYLLPANIYLEAFHGNFLARTIIVFFCVCGLITMISLLVKNVKKNLTEKAVQESQKKEIGRTVKDVAKTTGKKVMNILSKAFKALGTVCSGPVLLVILIIAVLFVVGLAASFALGIYNAILRFIEPFMENLLKTGKAVIIPSKLYGICQTVSLIAILFSSALTAHKLSKK